MNTTESLNSASSRAGVFVFSVAHQRVSHDHEHEHRHRHDHHTTSRLQPTRQRVGSLLRGHPGLWGTPLCSGRTPTVHRCPKGKAVGGPHETTSDRRQNDTDKRQDKRAFSEVRTGQRDRVDCTDQVLTHTLGILHGSGVQFVQAADHGEAAEPRGRERRQQSRSGEDPETNETSHHETSTKIPQRSVHRQSC